MVEVVEKEVEACRMEGVELFFLTDNSVTEAVYYWGNSRDKEIFELMPRLVYSEMRSCFRLHTIWIAGERETAAGIYCFSRGCLTGSIV